MNIRPGVAAVVFGSEGRILLHDRRVGDGWAPPSGGVEPGEALRDALRRELREETNMEVDIERLVGLYSDPAFQIVRYPDGRRVHFITTLFACRRSAGRLVGSDEGIAWKWFLIDNLPADLSPYARVWLDDALSGRQGVVR